MISLSVTDYHQLDELATDDLMVPLATSLSSLIIDPTYINM